MCVGVIGDNCFVVCMVGLLLMWVVVVLVLIWWLGELKNCKVFEVMLVICLIDCVSGCLWLWMFCGE